MKLIEKSGSGCGSEGVISNMYRADKITDYILKEITIY